jgi:hypothetical protein
MAIPNYTYLKLKIPRSHGVVAVNSDLHHVHAYEEENCDAQATVVEVVPESSVRKQSSGTFNPQRTPRRCRWTPRMLARQFRLAMDPSASKSSCSSTSYLEIGTSLHGKPFDMPGISREVIEHSLDILPGAKPVKQRLCCFDDEKQKAIEEEIAQLLVTGFIKVVFHPE